MRESLSAIGARLRPAVASIEAPNEPDKEGVPGWLERTRAYQADLIRRREGRPGLAEVPVLGPSLTEPDSWAAMGDLSPHLDRGNFHPYPGGGKPLHNIERERELATRVSGSKPLVITEIGYHSDVTTDSGHLPASERAIGAYTPRLALESYRAGVERAYLYQLADQWSDGEARAASSRDSRTGSASFGRTCLPSPRSCPSATCCAAWARVPRRSGTPGG